MVIAPGQCTVAAHGRQQFVLVVVQGGYYPGTTCDIHRGVLVGERHGLFFRQAELPVDMLHVA
ncbi:hypothetical protein D3C75_1304750 [compost metagenome]